MGDVFKSDIVWTSAIDKCSVQRGVHQSMPGTASIETSAQPDISIIGRKVSLKEFTVGRMKDLLLSSLQKTVINFRKGF
jgi:hypothetical protein